MPDPSPGYAGGYSTREAAKLLGLSEPEVRGFVRSGFLDVRRGRRGELRFTLPDLVLLRTAKALLSSVPPRRVKKALRDLKDRLPHGRPLSAVRVTAEGADVVVRDGDSRWEPSSGQILLDFDVAALARDAAPFARRVAEEAVADEARMSAEDWFVLGSDLEPVDAGRARDAYRRALELQPAHPDARVNLGRLLHEEGHLDAAERNYRVALLARPSDATAAFNLGVVLEDLHRRREAEQAYEIALRTDPALADAHFNLARLLEREGRKAAAIRHLAAYKRLSGR